MLRMPTELASEHLEGRITRCVKDLDEETVKAIANAEVPARYRHLDELNNG
jgi:hypothetical protein